MQSQYLLKKFAKLVELIRKDHAEQNALIGKGHDFTHALLVAHYCLKIAEGPIAEMAWVAALCHNTDRLFPSWKPTDVATQIYRYLRTTDIPDSYRASIVEAVVSHSRKPSPDDNEFTILLMDSDKLGNLDPFTVTARAAQWQPNVPPVDLYHLDQYPPGCNYHNPGSIFMDIMGLLEWEGDCEYEPGKKIPWLRLERSRTLAKPMFRLLRALATQTFETYKDLELIPYPFPEDFKK